MNGRHIEEAIATFFHKCEFNCRLASPSRCRRYSDKKAAKEQETAETAEKSLLYNNTKNNKSSAVSVSCSVPTSR